jgi:cell division protein FtsL
MPSLLPILTFIGTLIFTSAFTLVSVSQEILNQNEIAQGLATPMGVAALAASTAVWLFRRLIKERDDRLTEEKARADEYRRLYHALIEKNLIDLNERNRNTPNH